MNRRNFLKRCSLLPFVGSLAVVGEAVASKVKPKASMWCSFPTNDYTEICGGQNGTLCPRCKYNDNLEDWKVEVDPYDGRGNSDNIEIYLTPGDEQPAIWTTWSSIDGVSACKFEKGKWYNIVIKCDTFGNNQDIEIV